MMPEIESAQSGVERQAAPVIYLVDDDPSFLRALSRRLRGEGYEVECFDSVEEFLTGRRSDIPGCAVLDLHVIRATRSRQFRRPLPTCSEDRCLNGPRY